jgi:hypothetical protein
MNLEGELQTDWAKTERDGMDEQKKGRKGYQASQSANQTTIVSIRITNYQISKKEKENKINMNGERCMGVVISIQLKKKRKTSHLLGISTGQPVNGKQSKPNKKEREKRRW